MLSFVNDLNDPIDKLANSIGKYEQQYPYKKHIIFPEIRIISCMNNIENKASKRNDDKH